MGLWALLLIIDLRYAMCWQHYAIRADERPQRSATIPRDRGNSELLLHIYRSLRYSRAGQTNQTRATPRQAIAALYVCIFHQTSGISCNARDDQYIVPCSLYHVVVAP
ncbi:hypothetical protein V8C44DRAFT_36847 [Trichoderma aethiopicum]